MRPARTLGILALTAIATVTAACAGFAKLQAGLEASSIPEIVVVNGAVTVNPLRRYGAGACGSECTVIGDKGGAVDLYEATAQDMIRYGRRLRVDGLCISACTILVDRLAQRGLVCLTDRGRLFVHQMAFPDGSRRPAEYRWPGIVRDIERQGGQPVEGFILVSREAAGLPACR